MNWKIKATYVKFLSTSNDKILNIIIEYIIWKNTGSWMEAESFIKKYKTK